MDKPMNSMETSVLTVGHSTLTYEQFLTLVRSAGVTAIADVRTAPFSRHFPHFNRGTLQDELKADGIAYVFLGEELGGRPKENSYFRDGIANYEEMAKAPSFALGLKRLKDGAERYRIALMCSEHNPLDCHRCLLVGRALKEQGVSVEHIMSNGELRSQAVIEDDLLAMAGTNQDQVDFLATPRERLSEAYRHRAKKVAFAITSSVRTKATGAR
jgi:uncharacterized protein (DUF488 family)